MSVCIPRGIKPVTRKPSDALFYKDATVILIARDQDLLQLPSHPIRKPLLPQRLSYSPPKLRRPNTHM
jgi:hypothetical protein